jgi:hypothetical protein
MGTGGCAHDGASHGDADLAPRTIQFDAREAGRPPRGFGVALTGGGSAPAWVVRADPAPVGEAEAVPRIPGCDEKKCPIPLEHPGNPRNMLSHPT